MGLFHRNETEQQFAGGSKNVMESLQRTNDTGTLIYLDARQDFNTNSVITVAPNEQVIFIKNGEFYGTLPSGRHEVKTENYPLLSKIRNMLSGGVSTFSCQVYHVQTNEQIVNWGTTSPIEIQDFFLGNGIIGVPTMIRGAASFRVRFNIIEDDDASKRAFMRLMGDMSTFSVTDLSTIFDAEISQKISSTIGKYLENISRNHTSINAISSHLEDFASILKPIFDKVFVEYGLELVNFSFYNLSIDETEERKKYLDRLIASAHTGSYDKSVQQELLKDLSTNPNAAGLATAGAGIGMGMAAGNAFSQMYASAFGNPQSQQQPQPFGFGGQGRFGARTSQPAQTSVSSDDSNEDKLVEMAKSLSKYKKLFKEGRITEEQYNDMVEFIKNGMN